MTTDHNVKVVGWDPGDDRRAIYTARCSCGWHGTPWESRDLAQASANGHFAFGV